MKRNRPHGFTLLELVILIAILGLLLALLLPAVGAARQAAYKNSCRNKQKQITLSALTYQEANQGKYPALYFKNSKDAKPFKTESLDPTLVEPCFPWTVTILPFMEERNLYDAIKKDSDGFTGDPEKVKVNVPGHAEPIEVSKIEIEIYRCPVVSNKPEKPTDAPITGYTNYVALSATKQQLLTCGKEQKASLAEGIIVPGVKWKGNSIAIVRDGVSKTILFTETKEIAQSNWYHYQQTFVCGFLPGETSVENNDPLKGLPRYDTAAEGGLLFKEGAEKRTALNFGPTVKDPKAAYNSDAKDPLNRTWGPSSDHIGGVIIHAMGDGSVQDVSELIDPLHYYAAITRNGAEPFSLITE